MKPYYRYVLIIVTLVFAAIGAVARWVLPDTETPRPIFWTAWIIIFLLLNMGIYLRIRYENRQK